MKKLLFLCAILISTLSYGQVPDNFNVLYYQNVDSAIIILTKISRQQSNSPKSIEVTKEYYSQERNLVGEPTYNMVTTTMYFENITSIKVVKFGNWKIIFNSDITKQNDGLLLRDKSMAEQAFAALLCLIKNSGNKNYDQIMTNALNK